MKKLILILILIIPQICFASWWNPFSWDILGFFGLQRKNSVQSVMVEPIKDIYTYGTDTQKILPYEISEKTNQDSNKKVNKTNASLEDTKPTAQNKNNIENEKKNSIDVKLLQEGIYGAILSARYEQSVENLSLLKSITDSVYNYYKSLIQKSIFACAQFDSAIEYAKKDNAAQIEDICSSALGGCESSPYAKKRLYDEAEYRIKRLTEEKDQCLSLNKAPSKDIGYELDNIKLNIEKLSNISNGEKRLSIADMISYIEKSNQIINNIKFIQQSLSLSNKTPLNAISQPSSYFCSTDSMGYTCLDSRSGYSTRCSSNISGGFDCSGAGGNITCSKNSFGSVSCI